MRKSGSKVNATFRRLYMTSNVMSDISNGIRQMMNDSCQNGLMGILQGFLWEPIGNKAESCTFREITSTDSNRQFSEEKP